MATEPPIPSRSNHEAVAYIEEVCMSFSGSDSVGERRDRSFERGGPIATTAMAKPGGRRGGDSKQTTNTVISVMGTGGIPQEGR